MTPEFRGRTPLGEAEGRVATRSQRLGGDLETEGLESEPGALWYEDASDSRPLAAAGGIVLDSGYAFVAAPAGTFNDRGAHAAGSDVRWASPAIVDPVAPCDARGRWLAARAGRRRRAADPRAEQLATQAERLEDLVGQFEPAR